MRIIETKDGKEIKWEHLEYPSLYEVIVIADEQFKHRPFEALTLVPSLDSFSLVPTELKEKTAFDQTRWFYFERPTLQEVILTRDKHFHRIFMGDLLFEDGYVSIALIHASRLELKAA